MTCKEDVDARWRVMSQFGGERTGRGSLHGSCRSRQQSGYIDGSGAYGASVPVVSVEKVNEPSPVTGLSGVR